jgi:hypothetical protein
MAKTVYLYNTGLIIIKNFNLTMEERPDERDYSSST